MKEGDACSSALMAALELLQEECKGKKGVYKVAGDGIFIYVPEEAIREFEEKTGHKFGNPITDEELRKKAIEACKKGTWARHLTERFVGPEAPEEVKEAVAEKICRGLID